ncbi:MAG: hypothetical protein R3E96_11640 [Planctomycetota bacterium]
MDAAKGAYVVRAFDEDRPREGTLIVEGTSPMESILELLAWVAIGQVDAQRQDRLRRLL